MLVYCERSGVRVSVCVSRVGLVLVYCEWSGVRVSVL